MNNNFEQIVGEISRKLVELERINRALEEEVKFLKEKLGIEDHEPVRPKSTTIEKAFSCVELKGSKQGGIISRTANTLLRDGIKTIADLESMTVNSLKNTKGVGDSCIAITACVAEHYDVKIAGINNELGEQVDEYRKKLVFFD